MTKKQIRHLLRVKQAIVKYDYAVSMDRIYKTPETAEARKRAFEALKNARRTE